ncbi:hypothetical protein Zmor_012235 [Zophobas morio]|jgi:hypothetical protein|uniref:Uncharacterized protein n=1 Tax=Zophobas morio TaxID=2755281 RepID=A0AA38HF89_9CUCU|nr:hypothetical protein Zmor_012235 [Zophobas morio]
MSIGEIYRLGISRCLLQGLSMASFKSIRDIGSATAARRAARDVCAIIYPFTEEGEKRKKAEWLHYEYSFRHKSCSHVDCDVLNRLGDVSKIFSFPYNYVSLAKVV